jgi:hypothetical protein
MPEDGEAGVGRLVLTPEMRVGPGPAGIDAEALQRMVAQAIAQELQGELGERITRNLRKLVQSEVERALAEKAPR